MKKIRPKYKRFLICKSKKKQCLVRKQNREIKRVIERSRKKELKEKQKTLIKLSAPENFFIGYRPEKDFYEARNKLLNFIKRIWLVLEEGKFVHISFKNTLKLAPTGTLVFIAEFEKIIQKYPNRVTIDYPKDDVVEQLFQHIGLLEKMGMPGRKEITAENVRHWSYTKGSNVDTSNFKAMFAKYSSQMPNEVSSGLFESMSEAVTNSFQHAYPCPCENPKSCDCEKSWWMFAKQVGQTLEVVMYDAGIGIPKSLRNKPELKEWLLAPYERFKKKFDTTLIEVAVQSHRTSTKLPHRGKGLHDMLEFVKDGNVGGFLIYSGSGAFAYSATTHIESIRDFQIPIKGTLIQWEIPLSH